MANHQGLVVLFLTACLVLTVGIFIGGGESSELNPLSRSEALAYNFYGDSCAEAEDIIWRSTEKILIDNDNVPAQLLRLQFHDCFIEGCDASVLLNDTNSMSNQSIERQAIPNRTLKGFEYIETIKELLEKACPGVVSCADILVLTTRDAVALSGGPYYPLLTGRRDSIRSYFAEALAEIPRPDGNVSETLRLFSLRGFNERETVALLGGHNIGRISCEFIQSRIQNPDTATPLDFLLEIRARCQQPNNTVSNVKMAPAGGRLRHLSSMQQSPGMIYQGLSTTTSGGGFDSHYYELLRRGRGLLRADQELMANEKTAEAVLDYSGDATKFRLEFAKAMIKLSDLKLLVSSEGEIRRSCSALNSV